MTGLLAVATVGNVFNNAEFSPLDASNLLHWWDFKDLDTLYQDTAMTIPVTAHAQPIGKAICKKTGASNNLYTDVSTNRPLCYVTGANYAVGARFNTTDELLCNVPWNGRTGLEFWTVFGTNIGVSTAQSILWKNADPDCKINFNTNATSLMFSLTGWGTSTVSGGFVFSGSAQYLGRIKLRNNPEFTNSIYVESIFYKNAVLGQSNVETDTVIAGSSAFSPLGNLPKLSDTTVPWRRQVPQYIQEHYVFNGSPTDAYVRQMIDYFNNKHGTTWVFDDSWQ